MEQMIVIEQVSKKFGRSQAVSNISLEVNPGATMVLFGPSGCGKSTTLGLIAGFERPDQGRIYINGKLVSSASRMVAPHRRSVSMVFQDLALWPHLSVYQHLEFVLKPFCPNWLERQERIRYMLSATALGQRSEAYPHQLSGGERQRLALARALVAEPQVLLLDEPLSGLDSSLRAGLLRLIRRLLAGRRITAVYVSHNWQEACFLADQVAIMKMGQIEKVMGYAQLYQARVNPSLQRQY